MGTAGEFGWKVWQDGERGCRQQGEVCDLFSLAGAVSFLLALTWLRHERTRMRTYTTQGRRINIVGDINSVLSGSA